MQKMIFIQEGSGDRYAVELEGNGRRKNRRAYFLDPDGERTGSYIGNDAVARAFRQKRLVKES